MTQETPDRIVMYGTTWCSDCARAKRVFERYAVGYDWIDIERDPGAVDVVLKINGGMRSVPTIVFPDGSILVEPSTRRLEEKLGVPGTP